MAKRICRIPGMLCPPWLTFLLQAYLPSKKAFAAVWCRTSLIRGCCLRTLVVKHVQMPAELLYAQGAHLQRLHLAVPLTFALELDKLPHLEQLQLSALPSPDYALACCQHPSLRQAHVYLQHDLAKLPRQLERLTVGGSWQVDSHAWGTAVRQLAELFPGLQELQLDGGVLCQESATCLIGLPSSLQELRLEMDAEEFFVTHALQLAHLVAHELQAHVVVKVDIGGGFDRLVLPARASRLSPMTVYGQVRDWIAAAQDDLEFHDPSDAELYAGFLG